MIESNIDFVYGNEGLEYDPHPQRVNECYNEIAKNVRNLMNLFPKDLTPGELAIFESLGSLFDSICKYSDQTEFTIGYLEGFLEGEIKWNDELIAEKYQRLRNS